jgi:murein DD-endopeptidase MepM/ murein hydrolase activator NlpD
MASTFTSQSLTAINSGLKLEKLKGFERVNVKDLEKFNNLAGSLAGQGVNYAMGGDFTLNLLNLSFLTKNDNYNTGLLELHLGRNGATMNLGTGGANISFDNLVASFRGLNVWDVNNRISSFIKKEDDFDSAIALRVQYGFGDGRQKGQLWDILNGEAIINTNADGEFGAESVMNENGKKVITLAGYKAGMSVEDQLLVGVLLGHEAYRDGIITDDNYLETRNATLAHVQMALRMIHGGYDSIQDNDRLEKDINAYSKGESFFNNYVDNNYDSSGDYWKLIVNNDTVGFKWDGKYTFDLSAMEGYGDKKEVDKLDEEALKKMWELGGNKSFETFDEFKKAVGTFDTVNEKANVLKASLAVGNKKNAETETVKKQISDLLTSLGAVGNSGLFIKTDAETNAFGKGPIFASEGGKLTSDYGIRAEDWVTNSIFGRIYWHGAWDIVSLGNSSLVAPMDGILSLDFKKEGGLKLITEGEGNKTITYAHTNSSSIDTFIDLFSYNGVTLTDGKLNGIVKNTIIGKMGNTGTWSTGAHVHLTYEVNGKEQNPAGFFDKSQFDTTSDKYNKLMTGLSDNPDVKKFQYDANQIANLAEYISTSKTTVNQLGNRFFAFSSQTGQFDDFYKFAQLNKNYNFLPRQGL